MERVAEAGSSVVADAFFEPELAISFLPLTPAIKLVVAVNIKLRRKRENNDKVKGAQRALVNVENAQK